MKRYVVAAATILLSLTPTASAQSDTALRDLAERYWDALMQRSPMRATSIGDYRFNDRLDDWSEAARKHWRTTLNKFLSEARRLPARALIPPDRWTRDLLQRDIADSIVRLDCLDHLMPYDFLDGPHLQFPLILVSQPFRHADDFRNYIARLRGFEQQVTDIIESGRRGLTIGLIPPRAVVRRIIPQVREHIVRDLPRSEFLKPLRIMDTLTGEDRAEITEKMTDAVRTVVVPGYLRLLAFFEDEVLPRSRSTVGIGALPEGDKTYQAKVYLSATVQMTPDEVHQLGLFEVARIRNEMDKARKEVKFEGDLDAFLAHMRSDPKYRFESAEELLSASHDILERTKPLMQRLFNRLPKADCVIKPIEDFRAEAAPVAYYNPAPADGSRPGYYYVNIHAPKERLRFTLEALTYHESIPGHHFQMALDQENTDLPMFRRYGGYTAYVEGWALYTEKLGYEIGGYQDPYQRFGQLTFEMWRACRLVVDTGMHAKQWTRRQAIDFMALNTSLAMPDIESEIDRYITWPGQALGYKIGELRILEMRREAEEALGEKFQLAEFHDALLSGGAMPIDMLGRRMKAWIAERSGL